MSTKAFRALPWGGFVNAMLLQLPRNPYVLWHKSMFGIGGRKPARNFTREERRQVKFTYNRQEEDCLGQGVGNDPLQSYVGHGY